MKRQLQPDFGMISGKDGREVADHILTNRLSFKPMVQA